VHLNHALNNGGGSPSLELWQVINLLGSIALARLLLPPVIED
jgi:hypothetical protein